MSRLIETCYLTSSSGLGLKGVQGVLDCVVSDVIVNDVPDIRGLVESIATSVFTSVSASLVFDSNESIGYTHTLHRFKIPLGEGRYMGVRVVVRGKTATRVLFTIPTGVSVELRVKPSVYSPDKDTPRVEAGRGVNQAGKTLPPGQVYIDVPVVYAILGVPGVDVSTWRLRVEGLVENPLELTLLDIYEMGVETVKTDFHCVTGWSLRDMEFTGVSTRRLLELAKPKPSAKWAYVESLDGYSTVIPLEELLDEKALVAVEMNRKPLDILHGYPARLVIPRLYGWKSAKWITRIEVTREYRDGYWESLGYHPRGRVDLEERFKKT